MARRKVAIRPRKVAIPLGRGGWEFAHISKVDGVEETAREVAQEWLSRHLAGLKASNCHIDGRLSALEGAARRREINSENAGVALVKAAGAHAEVARIDGLLRHVTFRLEQMEKQ